jgi:hypothetical protein
LRSDLQTFTLRGILSQEFTVKKSQRSIFLILLLVTTLAAPSALAATKPKAAGRSSTSVVNTILNGKGAPSNSCLLYTSDAADEC